MGAMTPIGIGVEAFARGLQSGASGIAELTLISPEGHSTRFGGEVKNFDPEQWLERKEARRMDRFVHFAIAASDEAVAMARLKVDDKNADNIGVVIGCGIGGLATWEREHEILLHKGPSRVSPHLIPMMISNMASGHVSIRYGARGPNTSMVSACTSSAHALGLAYDWVHRGECDIVITGGTEAPICHSSLAGFGNMRALSRRNDDPQHASRPFDRDRDGFVIGEGAGIVVLESLESARQRGATVYAEILGHGMAGDAYHITGMRENGSGYVESMQRAMNNAGVRREEINYINAHGTSTPVNDPVESRAVRTVFGELADNIPTSSTKSQIGHLLGAGSAVEFIATVTGIERNFFPPTINLENPDADCDLDYVANHAREGRIETALVNSNGFGGHNATIVVRRYSEN